jgi:hypothetical protein
VVIRASYLAPYLGIAERAAEITRLALAARSADEAALLTLGEMYNELTVAQLAWRDMLAIANDYDVEPTPEHASRMLARKTLLANATRASAAARLCCCRAAACAIPAGVDLVTVSSRPRCLRILHRTRLARLLRSIVQRASTLSFRPSG